MILSGSTWKWWISQPHHQPKLVYLKDVDGTEETNQGIFPFGFYGESYTTQSAVTGISIQSESLEEWPDRGKVTSNCQQSVASGRFWVLGVVMTMMGNLTYSEIYRETINEFIACVGRNENTALYCMKHKVGPCGIRVLAPIKNKTAYKYSNAMF